VNGESSHSSLVHGLLTTRDNSNSRIFGERNCKVCYFKGRGKAVPKPPQLLWLLLFSFKITQSCLQKINLLDEERFQMDLPQVRRRGRTVAVQFIQRICPQTISNKENETFCRRWQRSLLRSHTVNQGRAEVDVKNGDQEHAMHQETSEYEDRYTHGNSGLARQSPTLRGSEKKYS